MASGLYAAAKKSFLDADIDMLVDNIKCVLVDSADYTVNLATHDFLNDVAAAGRVATSGNLASKTTTGGTFDAADVVLTTVTGDSSEAIIVYKDSGVESTSDLIAYIDSGTGLPVTPNGGDITIQWNASGIFSL